MPRQVTGQRRLWEEPPTLTCANGEPWTGPHPRCEAETDRACERFDQAVLAGEYDADGYTPNERREQERRRV